MKKLILLASALLLSNCSVLSDPTVSDFHFRIFEERREAYPYVATVLEFGIRDSKGLLIAYPGMSCTTAVNSYTELITVSAAVQLLLIFSLASVHKPAL